MIFWTICDCPDPLALARPLLARHRRRGRSWFTEAMAAPQTRRQMLPLSCLASRQRASSNMPVCLSARLSLSIRPSICPSSRRSPKPRLFKRTLVFRGAVKYLFPYRKIQDARNNIWNWKEIVHGRQYVPMNHLLGDVFQCPRWLMNDWWKHVAVLGLFPVSGYFKATTV